MRDIIAIRFVEWPVSICFPLYHYVAGNFEHFEAVWGLFSFAAIFLHFIVISTKCILKCKNFFHPIFFSSNSPLGLLKRIPSFVRFIFFSLPILSTIIASLFLVHVATFLMKHIKKQQKNLENLDEYE